MTTTVTTSHIVLDEQGRPWIDGTTTKVIEVVLDKLAHGWSPEEIHFQHPHLPLAKIHAALAYYYDHQREFDEEIERQLAREKGARPSGSSLLVQHLRSIGELA